MRSSVRESSSADFRNYDAWHGRDRPHHSARAPVLRRRAPRARRARQPPEPHAGAPRGPPAGAGQPARAGGRERGRHAADSHPRRRDRDRDRPAGTRRDRSAGRGGKHWRRTAAHPLRGLRRRAPVRARRHDLGHAHKAGGRLRRMSPDLSDKELLRRYHVSGDLAAREQLIERYLSLVRSLARRYAYRGEQLEDLVQIGSIGLIKAIDRFDINRGVELTTYATPNIIGEIKRHFRDKGWSVRVPRGLQELNVQLSRIVEELTVQLGRSPTIKELAERSGAEEEEVLEALESGRAYSSLSLSTGVGVDDEGDVDPLESLGTEEHEYEVSEDRAVLAPGFKVLDERERRILHLRFFRGLTQSQIAEQIGISQMHVSRLIRRSLEKIREEIAEETEVA